jgi:hypothetical protein
MRYITWGTPTMQAWDGVVGFWPEQVRITKNVRNFFIMPGRCGKMG